MAYYKFFSLAVFHPKCNCNAASHEKYCLPTFKEISVFLSFVLRTYKCTHIDMHFKLKFLYFFRLLLLFFFCMSFHYKREAVTTAIENCVCTSAVKMIFLTFCVYENILWYWLCVCMHAWMQKLECIRAMTNISRNILQMINKMYNKSQQIQHQHRFDELVCMRVLTYVEMNIFTNLLNEFSFEQNCSWE